ncbi:hypothetical protein LV89_01194 [Arcicella aurantiaca]|uniref:PD(D/E)XK endonuclease domain-containing protein n=1 Tax=Arcicella aurantiaca TaxID=591202 RepID=A0A316EGD3_9BACT|nr:hypothetical protein [Arcicella aurantiaca]PWK27787.1 hypothetical protein LV89_01194 [Arcicella aurantiaca]
MNNQFPNEHLYFGKAGHLFVMSEFLLRGWNVAIPEVDVGDDIFVVKDFNGELVRVQVKTSKAIYLKNGGYTAQFKLSLKQLRDSIKEVSYVLVVREIENWNQPIIIDQETLLGLYENQSSGSEYKDNLTLRLTFKNGKVTNKQIDLTEYQNNFEDFIIF